jgi:hypothetical protein
MLSANCTCIEAFKHTGGTWSITAGAFSIMPSWSCRDVCCMSAVCLLYAVCCLLSAVCLLYVCCMSAVCLLYAICRHAHEHHGNVRACDDSMQMLSR